MLKMHKPAMLVLLETRMAEHHRLTKSFNFDSQIQSSANGQSGVIVIMWKKSILKLENISITHRGIHVMVKVLSDPIYWLFSVVYASPNFATRTTL